MTIDSNDISLFDNPLHLYLTGGINGPGYRTWHIDSACEYHFGVGPPEGSTPDWWHASANEKPGVGLYDDRFTFHLVGYKYDLLTMVIFMFIILLEVIFLVLLKIYMTGLLLLTICQTKVGI